MVRRECRRRSFPCSTDIALKYKHTYIRFKHSEVVLQLVALDQRVTELSGCPFSSQTYLHKVDVDVAALLANFAIAHKIASDIRLLVHLKVSVLRLNDLFDFPRQEIEERFEKGQIGNSAMAYKRNPMQSQHVGSLARHLMALHQNALVTAAGQW